MYLWQYLTNQTENVNSTSHRSFCSLPKEDKCNIIPYLIPVATQSLSCLGLFATPWTAARQAPRPSLSPGVC